MKIARSEDLRSRLGLGDIDTFVEIADAASEEATSHLENDLRTPLSLDTYQDVFLTTESDRQLSVLKFKLSAAFINPASFSIGTGLTIEAAIGDLSLSQAYVANFTTGHITLTDAPLTKFIVASYDAGFPALAAPYDDVLNPATMPKWLVQLAEIKSIGLMGDAPELKNKENKIVDVKAYMSQYRALLTSHIRYMPGCRLPLP